MLLRFSGGELRTEMIIGWWLIFGISIGEIKVSFILFKVGFRLNIILSGIIYKLKKVEEFFFKLNLVINM